MFYCFPAVRVKNRKTLLLTERSDGHFKTIRPSNGRTRRVGPVAASPSRTRGIRRPGRVLALFTVFSTIHSRTDRLARVNVGRLRAPDARGRPTKGIDKARARGGDGRGLFAEEGSRPKPTFSPYHRTTDPSPETLCCPPRRSAVDFEFAIPRILFVS